MADAGADALSGLVEMASSAEPANDESGTKKAKAPFTFRADAMTPADILRQQLTHFWNQQVCHPNPTTPL